MNIGLLYKNEYNNYLWKGNVKVFAQNGKSRSKEWQAISVPNTDKLIFVPVSVSSSTLVKHDIIFVNANLLASPASYSLVAS